MYIGSVYYQKTKNLLTLMKMRKFKVKTKYGDF